MCIMLQFMRQPQRDIRGKTKEWKFMLEAMQAKAFFTRQTKSPSHMFEAIGLSDALVRMNHASRVWKCAGIGEIDANYRQLIANR